MTQTFLETRGNSLLSACYYQLEQQVKSASVQTAEGTEPYLVKALRESNSEDADEADTDETGGCSAENLFKLVALGRKESGRL